MTDLSHLDAINQRLAHERARVETARTDKERDWREHNVRMIERERESELAFLSARGITFPTLDEILSDDDLLKELLS